MGIYILVIVIIVVVLFGLFKSERKKGYSSSISELIENDEEYTKSDEYIQDFEEQYFHRIQAGEKEQLFAIISSQQDCGLVRSLLGSEGIPSYVENENINKMYGGVAATGVFSLKLHILLDDYDQAYEIVKGFASDKENHIKEDKVSKKQVAGALAAGLFFGAAPAGSELIGLGITILPKADLL